MTEEEKHVEEPKEKARKASGPCKYCGEPCGDTGLCITCKENGRE